MKTKNLESRLRAAIRREIKIAIAEEVKVASGRHLHESLDPEDVGPIFLEFAKDYFNGMIAVGLTRRTGRSGFQLSFSVLPSYMEKAAPAAYAHWVAADERAAVLKTNSAYNAAAKKGRDSGFKIVRTKIRGLISAFNKEYEAYSVTTDGRWTVIDGNTANYLKFDANINYDPDQFIGFGS